MIDEYFQKNGYPKTLDDVKRLLQHFEAEECFEKILPYLRPTVNMILTPTPEADIPVGQSKIGGLPDLPPGMTWPRIESGEAMAFVGQLNFSEIAAHDRTGMLPETGMLSFFYCIDPMPWGFDPADRSLFKVIYFESPEGFARNQFPENIDDRAIFKPNSLRFESVLTLPNYDDENVKELKKFLSDAADGYLDASIGPEHHLLGWPDIVQNPMERECQLVTNGLYCGNLSGHFDPRRKILEKGKFDWILLAQFGDEGNKTDMWWGDCGKLYFWIRKQDLQERNFDNVWCILQCG